MKTKWGSNVDYVVMYRERHERDGKEKISVEDCFCWSVGHDWEVSHGG